MINQQSGNPEKLKKFFVFSKGGSIFVFQTILMFGSGANNVITRISAILIVVVIIIPALNGGGC